MIYDVSETCFLFADFKHIINITATVAVDVLHWQNDEYAQFYKHIITNLPYNFRNCYCWC